MVPSGCLQIGQMLKPDIQHSFLHISDLDVLECISHSVAIWIYNSMERLFPTLSLFVGEISERHWGETCSS